MMRCSLLWSNILAKAGETSEQRKRIDAWSGWEEKPRIIRVEEIEMEHKKLSVGEKYLSVRINVGGQNFSFAAFKNTDKKGQEPDYKGQNIGIWITTKKAKTEGSEEGI